MVKFLVTATSKDEALKKVHTWMLCDDEGTEEDVELYEGGIAEENVT